MPPIHQANPMTRKFVKRCEELFPTAKVYAIGSEIVIQVDDVKITTRNAATFTIAQTRKFSTSSTKSFLLWNRLDKMGGE